MSFAAVINVNLEGHDPAESEKLLREGLILRIKALPGFQAARFLRSLDGTTGVGAVVFDSEANATAGLQTMAVWRQISFGSYTERPPEAPSAIYQVLIEI